MKYLLTLLCLSLIACADSGGGSSSPPAADAAVPFCGDNWISFTWKDTQTNDLLMFNSDCTGQVPSKGVTFQYEIIEETAAGATFYLLLDQDPVPAYNQMQAGILYECHIAYTQTRIHTDFAYISCGGPAIQVDPQYNTN